ncbi:MAG TPA: rhomboid family intramembrane serine protease [Rhizomicrobium sp.]|jgi:membrane associated rhomboid family serine protease|nr:rhomboid family intramembrane serine protease [Rhizomicrobium sp.]
MIPISDDNPARLKPVVTVALIVLCALAFAWELSLGAAMDRALTVLGFTPNAFSHPDAAPAAALGIPIWVTILTSMFLHAGFLHIAGNMLYLWIFGNNIEDAMGHVKFTLFYFVCGIAAALIMVAMDPASHAPLVGASGAISGVLAAYMLLYPRARVRVIVPLLVMFYPFRLRAVWVVGIWFALQLVAAVLTPAAEPGTAWWAHVGGFAAGLLLTPLLKSRAVPYFGPVDPRGPWANG